MDLIRIGTDDRYRITPHSCDKTYVIGTLKDRLNERFLTASSPPHSCDKTYVLVTLKNPLNEMVLLST